MMEAFVAGGVSSGTGRRAVRENVCSARRCVVRSARLGVVRMSEGGKSEAVEETVPLVQPSEEDMQIRDEVMEALAKERQRAADTNTVARRKLGATRDIDGKSNVWAVEPLESLDDPADKPNYAIFAIGVAALAVLIAGILPQLSIFNNPDQF
mmetsp:Transcript_6709/g.14342  ORF Transcript_6709/g.14342 Transcript_6709/m.14342 type:complete len:153 (-) Transcript_6709:64-522(-)